MDKQELFYNLIKRAYPTVKVEKLNNNKIKISNDTVEIALKIDEANWSNVKKLLDKLINRSLETDGECGICYNNRNHFHTCNKCTNMVCEPCSTNILNANFDSKIKFISEGKIVCPFCRYDILINDGTAENRIENLFKQIGVQM